MGVRALGEPKKREMQLKQGGRLVTLWVGDLGMDEVLVGREKGKEVIEDTTVGMIEEADTWNEMAVNKGAEQSQLHNRILTGDRQLEGDSKVPFKELDPNKMRESEPAQGTIKGNQDTWKRNPQGARKDSMQTVEFNKKIIQEMGLKRSRSQGINEGGQEVKDQKENQSKREKDSAHHTVQRWR